LRHGDLRNSEFPRFGLAPFANCLLMVTTATAEPELQIAPDDGRNSEDTERRLVADIATPPCTIARSDELRVLIAQPSHA